MSHRRLNLLPDRFFPMSSRSRLLSLHSNRWVHVLFGLVVSGVCLWFATRELMADPEAFSKAGTPLRTRIIGLWSRS